MLSSLILVGFGIILVALLVALVRIRRATRYTLGGDSIRGAFDPRRAVPCEAAWVDTLPYDRAEVRHARGRSEYAANLSMHPRG